ncbi:MAG: methionine--tRNA ligase subunit beta, partial [Gallionella sp.]
LLPAPSTSEGKDLLGGAMGTGQHIKEFLDAREYGKAVRDIMAAADRINVEINDKKPWDLAKDQTMRTELHDICSKAMHGFYVLSIWLSPILPSTTSKVAKDFFGMGREFVWDDLNSFPNRINTYQHLATRLDPKLVEAMVAANKETLAPPPSPARHAEAQQHAPSPQPSPSKGEGTNAGAGAPLIILDDFMKVDLRVAKIINAEHVEGAEKLLKLTLDIGEEKPRTVFAGIKSVYDPEKLKGRMTVMVANLAPRKMKFGLSEGMVLAASGESPGLFILSPDDGAQPGMRIK